VSKIELADGLAAPNGGHVDLLIVAAEHSGDEHAARLVRGLLARNPDLKVCALGGAHLAAAGAQLLRNLTGQSALGFAVIAKISYYKALIASVVEWIGRYKPRAVCFVDSSGLNLRIAKGLFDHGFSAKAGGPTKTLYYISPQIWASRAGRRFGMAQHLDGLASIFPFESAVYADTTLPVQFVGHPFVAADYVPPVNYDPNGPVLLLPGSRKGAVARIFPVLLEGYKAWGAKRPAIVLYPSAEILAVLRAANPPAGVTFRRMGEGGPVAASAVLTSSGTMSMHCALAGIPGVVTYKADLLTYCLGRMLVKVEYLGIANLLLKEPMYPEYIQGAAKPEALARELKDCLENPARRERTRMLAEKLRALLSQPAAGSAVEWMQRQLG
jgi:lipid-A-disaccharide synthase